ncbi:centrosomal protein of 152 kDa isoform X6 [Sphaerodactylus townsendi]|uniref:centrosomal protein of 152 kDa isoform X6 n=1 Tax=Sphaerodactylus townsendi TaxID=933632 RepID=UPI0020264594|nr:centrosomal protein of 152 kDa isoform X6 [Sphaerodactylus townsendi]
MLEDSGDRLSNFSNCSAPGEHDQVCEPWDQEARWNDHPVTAKPQNGPNLYAERFLYDQSDHQGEVHPTEWPVHCTGDEERNMYEISGRASDDGSDDGFVGRDSCRAPNRYPQDNAYHLPENFRPPYTNGHQQEFSNQHKTANFGDIKFSTSEPPNSQSAETYKVIYKPYQNNIQRPVAVSPDAARRNEAFEDLQQEFLGTGENAPDNVQILQLQVLNKARERQLEELRKQLEERAQQIRYLSHQLSIVKDEKDGMCLSLQESQQLHQNSKEKEVQLEAQIKALEAQIQTLAANEEKLIKQAKVAETAMESAQQHLLELRRSDALQRAREQHEGIVAALKQKYEEQVLSLQGKLDARATELQEQTELCCHLRAHLKQLERNLEESKLEKNAIINQLSRSLEESQNQCANLLQTGLVQETNQLRLQLQQAQSAQLICSEMNKALQEELKDLKEEIVLYESAAKHGVYLSDPGGKLNVDMTDSYVDLGIKKVNNKTRLHSNAQNKETEKELCKDELILELKAEMERLLNGNKTKRDRVSQLQNNLKECQKTIEELKQLVKTNGQETKGRNIESPSNVLQSHIRANENNLEEEIVRLQKEIQVSQQEMESRRARIQELEENEEKLKKVNQELCSQMRQMVQDFDRDKQVIDRYERTYRQHYEDVKKKYCEELTQAHSVEKEELTRAYDENIAQLKAEIDELNKEILTVKECYISVCREKDDQEATLKGTFEQEQQLKEESIKKQLLEEKEKSLNVLKSELEEAHKNSLLAAKAQWQEEKETDVKRRVENEVERAKASWETERKETVGQAIRKVEEEWQRRLDQAVEGSKRAVVELKDCCSQTQPVTIMDETLSQLLAREVEKQTLSLQEVLKEKEKALRQHEISLEMRRPEHIARQVELALTKARARWLQELTELEEYRTHLKAAQEKWEKDHEVNTAKQAPEDPDWGFQDPARPGLQNSEGETGDKARGAAYDVGEPAEFQRRWRKPPSLQETETDKAPLLLSHWSVADSKRPLSQEDLCGKRCLQQLERKEWECQDLRKKLDKVCRHLQLAVKEHQEKSEQWQENEKRVQALTAENVAMKSRLEDSSIQARSLSEGCVPKPCPSCDGKALEEMRSQYIKAVGKIKSDMLRYIQESKERAADIIKAEVLRERQETARKMRKYYLICLQQLLTDDGKTEGAEKKIICAAGKLATMAKILETPVRNSWQSTAAHSALPQNSKPFAGVEDPKGNHAQHPKQTSSENPVGGRGVAKKTNQPGTQKRIPCSLRQRLDAESPSLSSNTLASGNTLKQLDNVLVDALTSPMASNADRNAEQGLPPSVDAAAFQTRSPHISQTKFQNATPATCANSGGARGMPQSQNERSTLKEFGCLQPSSHPEAAPRKSKDYHVQEAPVKDDGGSVDGSLVSEPLFLERNHRPLGAAQRAHPSPQAEFCQWFPTPNPFSDVQEGASGFYRQGSSQRGRVLVTTSQTSRRHEDLLKVNPGHTPDENPDQLSSPGAQQSSAELCSVVGKSYSALHSKKRIRDVMDFQQDSGFDSPQINFD